MGYSAEYDDFEQVGIGEGFSKKPTDFERMCECFRYSADEFACLSRNEQQRIEWNWRNIQKGGA